MIWKEDRPAGVLEVPHAKRPCLKTNPRNLWGPLTDHCGQSLRRRWTLFRPLLRTIFINDTHAAVAANLDGIGRHRRRGGSYGALIDVVEDGG